MQNPWVQRVTVSCFQPPRCVIFFFPILIFVGYLLLKSNLFTVILVKFWKRTEVNVHIQSAIFNQRSLFHFFHGLIFKAILKYQSHCLLPAQGHLAVTLSPEFEGKGKEFLLIKGKCVLKYLTGHLTRRVGTLVVWKVFLCIINGFLSAHHMDMNF